MFLHDALTGNSRFEIWNHKIFLADQKISKKIPGTEKWIVNVTNDYYYKKAVLPQGNRAMPQVFFSVEVRQQHSLQV